MLEQLRRREADRSGLDVILIDVWEGNEARKRAHDYCQLWGIEGTVLLDEAGEYAKLLGVRGVPTNVLVDSTGTIHTFGASNPDELNARVDELLRDSPCHQGQAAATSEYTRIDNTREHPPPG